MAEINTLGASLTDMKTETPQDIENEILSCSDKPGDLRLRQLIQALTHVDSETIVEGVIRVFERSDRQDKTFKDQECAGQILQNLDPKTSADITQVIKRTLPNWDKSIEQLPFWLRDNYGLDKLKTAISTIKLSATDLDKLETIKWWLKLKVSI